MDRVQALMVQTLIQRVSYSLLIYPSYEMFRSYSHDIERAEKNGVNGLKRSASTTSASSQNKKSKPTPRESCLFPSLPTFPQSD